MSRGKKSTHFELSEIKRRPAKEYQNYLNMSHGVRSEE
jgi:hypothetical protein